MGYQKRYFGETDWQDISEKDIREFFSGVFHDIDLALHVIKIERKNIRTAFAEYQWVEKPERKPAF